MNEGQPSPVFFPDDVLSPLSPVPEPARPVPVRVVENRMVFGDLVDAPVFEEQASLYPDSVVETDLRFVQICTSSQEDQALYSSLQISSRKQGSKVIVYEAPPQWDPSKGAWHVLLKVSTRKFRSLITSRPAERDPSLSEPDTPEDNPSSHRE